MQNAAPATREEVLRSSASPGEVLVVHSPVGGGHRAAAEAIAEAARAAGHRAAVLDAFSYCPPAFAQSYLFAHRAGQTLAPNLYGMAYLGAKGAPGGAWEPLRRGFDHLLFAPLVQEVCRRRPSVVLATHHLPLLALGRARRTGNLQAPLFGVVTDYEAHGVWAERGIDAFAVGSRRAADDLLRGGVPATNVHITGIPTAARFRAVAPIPSARADGKIHALFSSGGVGLGHFRANPLGALLDTFRKDDPIAAVVVTGNNHAVREPLDAQVRAQKLEHIVTVVGYEHNMAARMEDADIIVGKAGGLTVAEALVAGRPLLLTASVPGNELANEAYVVEAGAAISATKTQVRARLLALHADRERLQELGRNARALAAPKAAETLITLAKEHAYSTY